MSRSLIVDTVPGMVQLRNSGDVRPFHIEVTKSHGWSEIHVFIASESTAMRGTRNRMRPATNTTQATAVTSAAPTTPPTYCHRLAGRSNTSPGTRSVRRASGR